MENSIYTVDYFIKKYQNIPDEEWITGRFGRNGKHCANGHCGVICNFESPTLEATALKKLFDILDTVKVSVEDDLLPVSWKVAMINDGSMSSYQQPTPKQRILAALYDIKAKQQPAPEVKVIYKTVVIDSTVKELSGQLTNN